MKRRIGLVEPSRRRLASARCGSALASWAALRVDTWALGALHARTNQGSSRRTTAALKRADAADRTCSTPMIGL
jgi:hypothetical protein